MTKSDGTILKEGKMDGIGWAPRHFRLTAEELEYYSTNELNHPTGTITLNGVTDVTIISSGSGREVTVRAPGRNYLFRASSAFEAESWRETISNAVKKVRGGEEVGIRKFALHTDTKRKVNCGGPVHPLSSTFENLELSSDAKEYIDKYKLKDHLAHALLACTSGKTQPPDPLAWMSEFLKKLSREEEENIHDSDDEKISFKENWRWYIYSAERKIDFWKELAKKQEKLIIPKEDLQKFTCFLPSIILRAIDEGKIKRDVLVQTAGSAKPLNPILMHLDAIVVFTDASGFTSLTEKLSCQPNGAEELGRFLNVFFGKLINIIHFFGGDIIKFSGDAVTIMWLAEGRSENDKYVAVYRACQCCLHVHKALTDYETPVEGVRFSFHIGVGFGRVTVMQVGGIFDRWEYCIAGPPLEQISIAEPLASSGETCLSAEAAALLKEGCTKLNIGLEPLTETSRHGFVMLTGLQDVPELTKRSDANSFYGGKFEPTILKKYIPASEFNALVDGSSFEEEMRRVTVLFLSIEGLDTSVEQGATLAQLLMTCCQRSIYALEGSVNKFLVDDKGILLLAVFGLPPLSHFGDDPVRGVLAGLRMLDSLKAEEVGGKVGVATGKVWCGVVGNDNRKEYTVLGDVVNLSARLMGNAPTGSLYVDSNTYKVLQSFDFEAEEIPPIKMKGKAMPVPVFRPTGKIMLKSPGKVYSGLRTTLATYWAQTTEAHTLKRVVLNQSEEGGGIVIITGPAGAGKSQLLEMLRIMQRTEKFTLLEGNNVSPANTHSVPFLCWQRIFTELGEKLRADPELVTELLGANATTSGDQTDERTSSLAVSMKTLISNMLAKVDPDLENWLPLLSKVMTGLEFGDSLVKSMTDGDVRHKKKKVLRDISMQVLEWYSSRRPTMVILHLQQCSSFYDHPDNRTYEFSRGIADLVLSRRKMQQSGTRAAQNGGSLNSEYLPEVKPSLIFVVCCRDNSVEMQDKSFVWLKDVARDFGSLIEMKRFTLEETIKYLGHSLGYSPGKREIVVPKKMGLYVHDMTMGNARLIDKIAEQFLEEEIVVMLPHGGIKVQPSDPADLEALLDKLEPNESIVSIAFSHFDRLPPNKQFYIKIASALLNKDENADNEIDYVTVAQFGRASGKSEPAQLKEVQTDCDQLVKDEIFKKCKERKKEGYRFSSKFWRIAAEKLTLQSQKWKLTRG